MVVPLILKQLFIVVSPQFAAFASGGSITYPSVLLQQLNYNDSSIRLDIDSSSWIGSIHGLTGIPAIFVPTLMQWKGRRCAFLFARLISIIGWVLSFTTTNITTILMAESCHGLGTNSLMAVSLLSLSELIVPKYRNISLIAVFVIHTLGITSMGIIGQYLHWKTISLVMGTPMLIAFLNALMWPESPSWLAYKGEYDKCEQAFVWLRGTDDASMKELQELIAAGKENERNVLNHNEFSLNFICKTVKSKDFYMPCVFMVLLLNLMYWSGALVFMIYGMEMIYKGTKRHELASTGYAVSNIFMFIGITITNVLVKYLNNKTVMLLGAFGTAVSLICIVIITILQDALILSKSSSMFLYFFAAFMFFNSIGINSLVFGMSAELMPVKHRGIGGSLFIIYTCISHAASLKLAPYMFLHIGMLGSYVIYMINTIVYGLLIWKYIPETKGRTLIEIEDYYCDLKFQKRPKCDGERLCPEI